jgi:hypothetical protein
MKLERITNKYGSKLEKLLSIFEQNNFIDENGIVKEFKHTIDIEEIKIATDILHYAGTDSNEKKKIEIEQEAWRSLNAMFEDKETEFLQTILEKDKKIEEKDKKIEENEKLIAELMKKLDQKK